MRTSSARVNPTTSRPEPGDDTNGDELATLTRSHSLYEHECDHGRWYTCSFYPHALLNGPAGAVRECTRDRRSPRSAAIKYRPALCDPTRARRRSGRRYRVNHLDGAVRSPPGQARLREARPGALRLGAACAGPASSSNPRSERRHAFGETRRAVPPTPRVPSAARLKLVRQVVGAAELVLRTRCTPRRTRPVEICRQ